MLFDRNRSTSHGFSAAAHLVAAADPRIDAGHCHMDIELQCWDRPVDFLLGGTLYRLQPDTVVMFWAGRPHQLVAAIDGSAPRVCWITVPAVWLQTWQLGTAFSNRLLAGEVLTAPNVLHGAARMAEWAELVEQEQDGARIAYYELQALFLRLRQGGKAMSQASDQDRVPAAILRAISWLMEHVHEGCNAHEVGPAIGLHSKYMMSLFKKHVGQSLQQYINNMRVVEAQRLLLASDDSITNIALKAGFHSLNRFYTVFRQQSGMSPRSYRQHYLNN